MGNTCNGSISLFHVKFHINTPLHFLFMTERDTTPPDVSKIKICGVLEKLHKNHLLRYQFDAYFIQTSMCCYDMSQNFD